MSDVGSFAVKGSRSRIQQVIMNLLSNARDALEDRGDKRIDILLKSKNGKLILMITDNGKGIQEEIISKIFDPFFTTKEVNKGTGLGLDLAHSIVNDHLGTLSVHSEINVGTTFELSLPSSVLPVGLDVRSTVSTETLSRIEKKYSALVVDDEPAIREIIAEILNDLEIDVFEAEDGVKALSKAKEMDFDLVISDIEMPMMDGPQFLNELLKIRPKRMPKFIFITGGININAEVMDAKLSKHITAIITKPFDFNEITELLKDILDDEIEQVA